jgi:hypothetical protein
MNNREEVERLQQELRDIVQNTRKEFGKLNRDQLNWKPYADRWSVAQCFDHLINSNSGYFGIYDAVAAGTFKQTLIQKLPGAPKMWGQLLIKSLDPKTTRKLKAPKKFQPASSNLNDSIIDDFVNNQNRVLEFMEKLKTFEVDRIIITSPVASVVTYSVLDSFRIVEVHERRHFEQARRVMQDEHFPP